MEKRGMSSLGIREKKLRKCSRKKRLLKKIVDYLKSDSFMFGPLVSSQPSDSPRRNPLPISPTGVETMIHNEGKDEKLFRKAGDYLKSDTYMYAPLIDPQPSDDSDANTVSPHSGQVRPLERVTTVDSTRKITTKAYQPTAKTVNTVGGDHPSENTHLKSSIVIHQTLAHRETVKHVVHQNCRSSSVSGKRIGTEPRKLVVE